MFKFTVTTVRPTANAPFFIHTAVGQVYQELMTQAKKQRPQVDGPERLTSFERTESDDGLTMISAYSFNSPEGKDELFAAEAAIITAQSMAPFKDTRDEYNLLHGHVTTVEVEIV
jgi:hypothetical protein